MAIATTESIDQPRESRCPQCGRACPPFIVQERGYCCASKADRELILASLGPGGIWTYNSDEVMALKVAGDVLSDAWGEPAGARYPWTNTEYADSETVPLTMLIPGGSVQKEWDELVGEPAIAPEPSTVPTRKRGLKAQPVDAQETGIRSFVGKRLPKSALAEPK